MLFGEVLRFSIVQVHKLGGLKIRGCEIGRFRQYMVSGAYVRLGEEVAGDSRGSSASTKDEVMA